MSKFNKIINKQRKERQEDQNLEILETQENALNDLTPVQRRTASGTQHGILFKRLNVDLIDISPYQPRFMAASNQEELNELADNIRQNGQINPILVRPKNGRYELIGGERRLQAIRDLLKLKDIDCLIKDISDEKAAITALVDNINRADLSDFEIANALKKSCDHFGYAIEKVDFVTEKFNISRNKYYRLVSLFDLPEFISDDLIEQPILLSGSGASLLKTALNKVTELLGISIALELLNVHWAAYKKEFQQHQKRHTQFIKDFENTAYEQFQAKAISTAKKDLHAKHTIVQDQSSPTLDPQNISLFNLQGKKIGSLKCTESLKGNTVVSIRFNTKSMTEDKLTQLKNLLQSFDEDESNR